MLAKLVLLQQVTEAQDHLLIRDPVADQLDATKVTHGKHLDQGLFHRWIAEQIPLLQKVDLQHGRGGLNRIEKGLPGHRGRHLREKILSFDLLFGRDELLSKKPSCLPLIKQVLAVQSRLHCSLEGLSFQGLPK